MPQFLRVEDLIVYQRLCRLHLRMCDLCTGWPAHERFELASQIRRSSNSAPANLAERHSDRHARNKIEGVNRARGEALETIHHLFMAKLKGYMSDGEFESVRDEYFECVRMLNGMERTLERQLPERERRFPMKSTRADENDAGNPHCDNGQSPDGRNERSSHPACIDITEPQTLNPEAS